MAVVAGSEWRVLAAVAAGGVLGSLARWGTSLALPHQGDQWPWVTLLVNVTGSFLLGALVALIEVRRLPVLARPFVGAGLLGGWTTFSAWMGEALTLFTAVGVVSAGAYLLVTVLAGVIAAGLGTLLVRRVGGGS